MHKLGTIWTLKLRVVHNTHKCPVGELSVGEMSVGEMSVGEMSVG